MNSRALRGAGWIALAGLAAALVAAGYWLLFTTFMVYDDEGYVLYSLKNYGEHGRLYDDVFSQYGPFFFAFYDALHRVLGFAWTNTNGRILTLVHWVLTAGFSAALVWRATKSVTATAFAYTCVFTFLWVMINEPSHPGGPIGCFVALAALIGVIRDPSRSPAAAAAIGAIGAALALTKINVGAFLLFSTFSWIVYGLAAPPWARRFHAGALLTLGLFVMPWLLMNKMLGDSATRLLAVTCSLATMAWVAVMTKTPRPGGQGLPALYGFLIGAAGLTAATIAVTLLRGTSPMGLLSGVLLGPLNQPNVFSFSVQWQPLAAPITIAAACLGIWVGFRPDSVAATHLTTAARLAAAVAFAMAILRLGPFKGLADVALSYGVGLAAVCAFPLRRNEAGLQDARIRLWLACLLVLQALHAYPVAGSQINWATFLWVPLLVLALRDSYLAWTETAEVRIPRWLMPLTGAVAAWALCGFMTYRLVESARFNRGSGERLELPGAEAIQPPDNTAFGMRIMAENAKAHASLLYSLPGLYSMNLWTGIPTPTLDNATQWFLSLSTERQDAIREKLRADPRAALVVQLDTLQYLVAGGFRLRGALGDYLGQEFQKAFEVDGYAFWVHRGREIAPLSTGRATVDVLGNKTRLDLVVAAPARPVARIELWFLGSIPRTKLITLGAGNASLTATPLNESGKPAGIETDHMWSKSISNPIVRLTLEFEGRLEQKDLVLVSLFDAQGERLAAVRVIP